jgi:hypothetical protein
MNKLKQNIALLFVVCGSCLSVKEIDALKDKQEQEKAHQINRRVEFKVISKPPSDD